MKQTLLLLVLLLGFGFAQEPQVSAPFQEVDRFTGEVFCGQVVLNGNSIDGLLLGRSSDIPQLEVVFTKAVTNQNSDSAWALDKDSNSLVYVLFPNGDVETYIPQWVRTEDADSEQASVISDALAYRLLSSPGDINVRFSGPAGQVDFTINHEVILALAAGFGQTCLD